MGQFVPMEEGMKPRTAALLIRRICLEAAALGRQVHGAITTAPWDFVPSLGPILTLGTSTRGIVPVADGDPLGRRNKWLPSIRS